MTNELSPYQAEKINSMIERFNKSNPDHPVFTVYQITKNVFAFTFVGIPGGDFFVTINESGKVSTTNTKQVYYSGK